MSLFSKIFRKSGSRDEAPQAGWIEPRDLAAGLAAGTVKLVVDVRGPDEFSGPLGHIRGARNLPLNSLAAQVPGLVGQGKAIVVVCRTDRRSAAAARLLRDAGAQEVTVLRGGMEAWNALALPTG